LISYSVSVNSVYVDNHGIFFSVINRHQIFICRLVKENFRIYFINIWEKENWRKKKENND